MKLTPRQMQLVRYAVLGDLQRTAKRRLKASGDPNLYSVLATLSDELAKLSDMIDNADAINLEYSE